MPKFLIERDWPGAGSLSASGLKELAQQSCVETNGMQSTVQWIHSYITDNKLYAIYWATGKDALLEYASYAGVSIKKIKIIKQVIDPVTAE